MVEKKNFYIFLDVDGVLWDWDWRLDAIDKGKIKHKSYIAELNPKSIEALNFLIEKLNENFNAKLVISATCRSNLEETREILQNNGLKYDDELYATKISAHQEKRGEEILDFLSKNEKGDFIILDDESFDYKKHFDSKKIIKTSLYDNSLNKKHIEKWLKENKIELENPAEREY